ncbi:MAG: glycosyltransferase family 2 protein [Clostridia bacterium]|nr:glycosyltransferase family 2 protein [Clostridia bacterium]
MDYKPLVSVLIPNYNYGCYLKQCLDSVLNQTYPNIEVIFRDNNSDDDSYEIALSYREKFEKRGIYFFVAKNKRNVGSCKNSKLCYDNSEGDYIIYLSSDDAIKPTFIESCVDIFTKYPSVGMVMVNREEMDENGVITKTPPFYNQSCVIPKEEQAAVFMMAGIAVPSQVVISRLCSEQINLSRPMSFKTSGDWMNNFIASCFADVAFIAQPLCQYRVHSGNETSESELDLTMIFEHFLLVNTCAWIAENFGMRKPAARREEAVRKLGDMCMRYTFKMLKCGKKDAARKYLQLAPVFKESIVNEDIYKELSSYLVLDGDNLNEKLYWFEKNYSVRRMVSYDPPEGYIPIE